MKKILTIAASDSGGGAGIQADIKTITCLGGFGMSVVTALTAQNTLRVQAVHPVPPEFVRQQLDAVLQDIGADALKTGMLLQADTIRTIADVLRTRRLTRIVVDPVMKSKAGDSLLEQPAVEVLKEELLPLCLVVTPNLDEASVLSGIRVDSIEKMKAAAIGIYAMGPQNVLIKGGHLEGECIDLLYDGKEFLELGSPRITTKHTHGTGCTFSAALATFIARELPISEAARQAKEFVTTAIRFSIPLGSGHGPTNPYAAIAREAQIAHCRAELKAAVALLQRACIGHVIPEVQSNLGYALPSAATPDDVVAFPGRIVRLGKTITCVAEPEAGASRHIAKVILTVLHYDSRYRSAMNIAWSPAVSASCRALGFSLAEFDRKNEPAAVKEREGSTLEWGTAQVMAACRETPDIIYDTGDVGKEPMTRVLGTDPADVARKIVKIAQEMERRC